MTPPLVDDHKRAPMRGLLGRHARVVFAIPVVFALAAFFAVSLVPPTYRASIELSGSPGLAERWLAGRAADGGSQDGSPKGPQLTLSAFRQLTRWIAGEAALSPAPAAEDRGVRPAGPQAVVVWAESADRELATAHASALADAVAGSQASAPAVVGTVAAEPPVSAASSPVDAGSQARTILRDQAAAARAEASASRKALDDYDADPARAAGVGDDGIDRRFEAAEARARTFRARIDTLRSAARQARAGIVAAQAAAPVAGWADLESLARQRRELGERVETLGRTLLDGHPRMAMARLQLADLESTLRQTGGAVGRALDARARDLGEEAAAAEAEMARLDARRRQLAETAAERERLERQAERDEDVAVRLEATFAATEAAAAAEPSASAPPAASPAAAPPAAPPAAVAEAAAQGKPTRIVRPIEILRPSPWPAVAGAALAGLALSLLGVGASRLRLRDRPGRPPGSDAAETPDHAAPAAGAAATNVVEVAGRDVATVDDVIDALIASGISRAMLLAPSASARRPLGVDIVRRLALRGQSAALVDLSEDQTAARAMGAGLEAPGITDLIEGDATFATIARRDFATRADIVPGGRHPPTSKLDTVAERRNVLDFIERSYETLLVDCGRMAPTGVKALIDTDAALLLAVHGASESEVEAAVRALNEAGLDDLILVGEARADRS